MHCCLSSARTYTRGSGRRPISVPLTSSRVVKANVLVDVGIEPFGTGVDGHGTEGGVVKGDGDVIELFSLWNGRWSAIYNYKTKDVCIVIAIYLHIY